VIKWKEYSDKDGELIEFCCDSLQAIYSNLLTWDQSIKKWCLKVDRITTLQDPYTSKYIVKKVDGIQDLKAIDYCPFCGANCYKEELRYDAWPINICGTAWDGMNVYICGHIPSVSGTV